MRIENKMKCTIYYPYAGKKYPGYGTDLKAGEITPELPISRFYDENLQRDWKAGKVEVYINDSDRAIMSGKLEQVKLKAAEDDQLNAKPVAAPVAPTPKPVEPEGPRVNVDVLKQRNMIVVEDKGIDPKLVIPSDAAVVQSKIVEAAQKPIPAQIGDIKLGKNVSIEELNKRADMGVPDFPKAGQRPQQTTGFKKGRDAQQVKIDPKLGEPDFTAKQVQATMTEI